MGQRGAVVAIRTQAVAEGALSLKLTGGVSGSDSGHDPMTYDFRIPSQLSAHAAWRSTHWSDEVQVRGDSVRPVHSVPEDRGRALEHRRWHPMRIELTGFFVRGSRSDFRSPRMSDITRCHQVRLQT